jgi:hypothetical protein
LVRAKHGFVTGCRSGAAHFVDCRGDGPCFSPDFRDAGDRNESPEERPVLKQIAIAVGISALTTAAMLASTTPGQALTVQECSAKYKAAQATGDKTKWNDFRKTQCGETATPAATPTAAAKPAAKPAEAPKPVNAPAAAPVGNAVFPSAVAPQYAKESAGKAREKTCLDQYKANKATNGNGGLNWIQKGGGYYSECNKRLKG